MSAPTGCKRATGVHYHREGEWRFQRARNVVVAGYAVETPRLLLNSANGRSPDGLANSSGLVGKNLMTQSNRAVWGRMEQEVRWNKGPPSLATTERWNVSDDLGQYGPRVARITYKWGGILARRGEL